jgi:hypothetical protein
VDEAEAVEGPAVAADDHVAFHLDVDSIAGVVPHDYIRCGTPVSVGSNPEVTSENGESGILHRVAGKLNEVSIIRSGLPAYRRRDLPTRGCDQVGGACSAGTSFKTCDHARATARTRGLATPRR